MSEPEDAVSRAEELLARLEASRARLEEAKDPDVAIEVLSELAEIAREVEAELERAQRKSDDVA